MDTKFSVAMHILVLISESPKPINSEQMALSVGTNASYIRKILGLLKKSNIIDNQKGTGGYTLTTSSKNITLLKIYQAVEEDQKVHILDIHQNPNEKCSVGRCIKSVIGGIFKTFENEFAKMLNSKILADIIEKIHGKNKGAKKLHA